MYVRPDYRLARDLLLEEAAPVDTERIPLEECGGRVLAEAVRAAEDVPPFPRSPYDGYAIWAGDTAGASEEKPVTLRILEEIPAGGVPSRPVTRGTAVKILTGAPIPPGADAVVMFEKTTFGEDFVTLTEPVASGSSIVAAGEDVKAGALLARKGAVIDPGLSGTLAAQGMTEPLVYRRPVIGLLSTGAEVREPGTPLAPGQIRNSNRYTLTAALKEMGCQVRYLGCTGDEEGEIAARLQEGLADCDGIISTGGVSVGDYDRTPAAMEFAGAKLLIRGIAMKPGMACAFARKEGKLLFGLSGNPASAMTTFYGVVRPVLEKLKGRGEVLPQRLRVVLAEGFAKGSPCTRLLRGRLSLIEGDLAHFTLTGAQGNQVLSTAIGCNAMAEIPAGSGPLPPGAILEGFVL